MELAKYYPEEQFFHKTGAEWTPMTGPCLNEKIGISGQLPLKPVWNNLIVELRSSTYRYALEELTKLNLENHFLQFNFSRYNSGQRGTIHTDPPFASLVQIFYFNEEWNRDWGGCLRILKDENPQSVFRDILPLLGSSIIILPSENSWHTVTPVIPEVNRTRLTFVLIFFQQSAEAVLYDIFKQQKLLFYKLD
ncbi:2OG-Fe(II) oxygenase [Nostoc sp.]|uniref:2OG-Fe(II) oxygenase n=1 Tax=Nostoc sp. TaxID=1180 RepID=UPI002FF2EA7C